MIYFVAIHNPLTGKLFGSCWMADDCCCKSDECIDMYVVISDQTAAVGYGWSGEIPQSHP